MALAPLQATLLHLYRTSGTSAFSPAAVDTARGLGSRIVLIDGLHLSRLMIRYNVGCRDEDVLYLKKIDEDFSRSDARVTVSVRARAPH